jgi:hypothetical protein
MTLVQRPAPKVKPSTSFHVSFCLPSIYIFFEKKEKREKKIFPVLAPEAVAFNGSAATGPGKPEVELHETAATPTRD